MSLLSEGRHALIATLLLAACVHVIIPHEWTARASCSVRCAGTAQMRWQGGALLAGAVRVSRRSKSKDAPERSKSKDEPYKSPRKPSKETPRTSKDAPGAPHRRGSNASRRPFINPVPTEAKSPEGAGLLDGFGRDSLLCRARLGSQVLLERPYGGRVDFDVAAMRQFLEPQFLEPHAAQVESA